MGSIPQRWEDVTAEWMTDAISSRCPGARVSDVAVLMSDSGNNRRGRLALRYERGTGPEVVFVKAEGDFRQIHAQNGNMFGEADLFASGIELPLDHPLAYKVVIDRDGLDYVIVMEDVTARGGDPRDATRPMSVSEVANGLEQLAALHSRFWNFSREEYPALAWVQDWSPTAGYLEAISAGTARALDGWAPQLVAEVRDETAGDLIDLLRRYINSLAVGAPTLLHGDAHIGNTYVLPDGHVGFLDWPVVKRGNWSQDVGYFLVGALTVEDRRQSDAELIETYRAALDLPGSERPTAEECWLRYRTTPAFGLPIWLATLSARTSQPEDVCVALCERYAAAFYDLDTRAALTEFES